MSTIIEQLAILRGKKEAHELVVRRALGVAGVPTGLLLYHICVDPQKNLQIALFALILGCLGIAAMSQLDIHRIREAAIQRVKDAGYNV